MAYEMWSPVSAPSAATRMTRTNGGSPVAAAKDPNVMTRVSLGTKGKKPSSAAIPKSAR
jgi:hypothetical protein